MIQTSSPSETRSIGIDDLLSTPFILTKDLAGDNKNMLPYIGKKVILSMGHARGSIAHRTNPFTITVVDDAGQKVTSKF